MGITMDSSRSNKNSGTVHDSPTKADVTRVLCDDVVVTEDFTIDPAIESFLPRCDHESWALLTQSLKATRGALEPLVVWKERNVLLDGHRRYKICQEYGLPFKVRYMSFPDEIAARQWIFDNQRMRRNWTPHERALALAALHSFIAAMKAKQQMPKTETKTPTGRDSKDVTKYVADTTQTSPRHVTRAVNYARAFRRLDADVQTAISAGKVKASYTDVAILAGMSKDQQKEALKKTIEEGSKIIAVGLGRTPSPRQRALHTYGSVESLFQPLYKYLRATRSHIDYIAEGWKTGHEVVAHHLLGRLESTLEAWKQTIGGKPGREANELDESDDSDTYYPPDTDE